MPTWLMKNWKACEEDFVWVFSMQGPYHPWIGQNKKNNGLKWITYYVPCGVERNINPSFNFLNWKTHLSLKANGLDNLSEAFLKVFDKEVRAKKEAWKEQEKVEATTKQKED